MVGIEVTVAVDVEVCVVVVTEGVTVKPVEAESPVLPVNVTVYGP